MEKSKMSALEMVGYYRQVHKDALARNCEDSLSAVIHPGEGLWVNQFTDYAHRLGMRNAFVFLESKGQSLSNRSVLDLGCGRGRWSRKYASRGAQVTGVDISPDAISLLSEEMPQHRFLCEDILRLQFRDGTFDVINSVTVMQHMPETQQRKAFQLIRGWLKTNGYLVLMENIADFDAAHVFPHPTKEWVEMVEGAGLTLIVSWGSNFESLFRAAARARSSVFKGQPEQRAGHHRPPHIPRQGRTLLGDFIALLSFPVELLCHRLPLAIPTHSVMIFRKA